MEAERRMTIVALVFLLAQQPTAPTACCSRFLDSAKPHRITLPVILTSVASSASNTVTATNYDGLVSSAASRYLHGGDSDNEAPKAIGTLRW